MELVGTKQKVKKVKMDWGWDKEKNRLIGKDKKELEVPEFHKETIHYLDKKRNRRNMSTIDPKPSRPENITTIFAQRNMSNIEKVELIRE